MADEALVQIYRQRGEQLAACSGLTTTEPEYASATALTAIHSAIAYQDAVLLRLQGALSRNPDHTKAAKHLEKTCRGKKVESSGLKHLNELVGYKTAVSYGPKVTTTEFAAALAEKAQRFQVWALKTLGSEREK
jgi:hypothetical protein